MSLTPSKELEKLRAVIADLESCGVAFSAGIDSTLVLKVAKDVLGDRAIGFIGISDSLLQEEREEALELAEHIGVELEWVDTFEIESEGYQANAGNRCYFCKQELHSRLIERTRERGLKAVCDGLHVGDMGDIRPGIQAADEKGVRHPLVEAGFDKKTIRAVSKELGLPNWDKPQMACLSSRVPFGTRVTREVLLKIAQAESGLRSLGYRGFRVRHHGDLARLEMAPQDLDRAWLQRQEIGELVKKAGYVYVSFDTSGYRTGSAHEGQSP